jgi:hypothetical protein
MTRKVWLGIVAAAVVFAAAVIAPGTARADPATSTTTAAPVRSAERGATPLATKAVFSTFANANLPGMCLANHHPGVFMFGGCTGQHLDQYWAFNDRNQLVNYWTGKCLAAHADSLVFTIDCSPAYADQIWRNYQGIGGMLENAHLAGRCLAAHADGKVFLFTCSPQFNDQYWIFAS